MSIHHCDGRQAEHDLSPSADNTSTSHFQAGMNSIQDNVMFSLGYTTMWFIGVLGVMFVTILGLILALFLKKCKDSLNEQLGYSRMFMMSNPGANDDVEMNPRTLVTAL